MISLNSTIVIAQEQVSSGLGDETAILGLKNGVYYTLDEVGTSVWKLIHRPTSVSHVLGSLLAEFEVEPQSCERDLLTFLEQLAAEELIEIRDETAP